MRVNKKQRIQLLSAFICTLFFVFPGASNAALTSPNYQIDSPAIGSSKGTEMSSDNYSITSSKGSSLTVQTDDGVIDSDTDSANIQGTKKKMLGRPNDQTVISKILDTENLETKANQKRLNEQTLINTQIQETNVDLEDVNPGEEKKLDPSKDEKDSRFPANLISSGARETFNKLKDLYVVAFAHFPARALTFIWIIGFLYLVRTYTAVGRKYTPF